MRGRGCNGELQKPVFFTAEGGKPFVSKELIENSTLVLLRIMTTQEFTKGQRYLLCDSKHLYTAYTEASVLEISPSGQFIKFRFDSGVRWDPVGKWEVVEKLYTPSQLKEAA